MESFSCLCYIIYKGDDFMWTRKELKISAKDFLREHYWKAFIICLIFILLTTTHISTNLTRAEHDFYMEKEGLIFIATNTPIKLENRVFNYIADKTFTTPIIFIPDGIFWVLSISFILFNIFVGSALEVGKSRFFLDGFRGDVKTKTLWSYFDFPDEYLKVVKTIFLRNLYILLWTLLFIIPGIMKSFEYRMVPYILANEGYLSPAETIKRSTEMTTGHKWDIFVLDLSFILWDILGYLILGLGGYFVAPYREATYAKLYEALSLYDEIDEDLILE